MSTDEYRDLRDRIDAQSGRTETRFGEVDVQLERINRRFEQVDRRFDQLEERMRRYMDILYEKFHADVQRIFEGYDHQTTVLDDHERRIQALEHPRLRFEG